MMRRIALFLATLVCLWAPPALAREVVEASEASDLSVTIYRDPTRGVRQEMERDYPQGLALISETRTVTLPAGPSTIRFVGVAEGMIGVSAIVKGLPGGTIEMNRDTALLSPGALVDGTLGNRVTITRTNPATGEAVSEQAIIRNGPYNGLVLETSQGFEAIRCSGLPEGLTFNRVPAGLNAKPVFSVDTNSEAGGTFEVTLTYLSWGFDWQADYVATMREGSSGREFEMHWLSWLSLLNDNGQSFNNARLQIIAGEINIDSDYEGLAEPPEAEPLRIRCYPRGSTAEGSAVPRYEDIYPPPSPPPPPPAMMAAMDAEQIVVTGSRIVRRGYESVAPIAVVSTATEEDLGDLKLFRVPGRVDVSAKGLKQVAFLNKEKVKARQLYIADCNEYYDWIEDLGEPEGAELWLVTKNEERKGLGVALPQGPMSLFESGTRGPQLAAYATLRDYARGQDVELELAQSAHVFTRCGGQKEDKEFEEDRKWFKMLAEVTNANSHPIKVRLKLGYAGENDIRFGRRKVRAINGYDSVEVTIPANSERTFKWKVRSFEDE